MLYMCSLYVFALKRWLGSFPKADSHFVAQVSVCTVLVFGKVSLMETVLVGRECSGHGGVMLHSFQLGDGRVAIAFFGDAGVRSVTHVCSRVLRGYGGYRQSICSPIPLSSCSGRQDTLACWSAHTRIHRHFQQAHARLSGTICAQNTAMPLPLCCVVFDLKSAISVSFCAHFHFNPSRSRARNSKSLFTSAPTSSL